MKIEKEEEVNFEGEVLNTYLRKVYSKKEEAQIKAEKKAKLKANKMKVLLSFIALALSAVLYLFHCRWYIFIIPIVIHLALAFYTFAKWFYTDRNQKRAWSHYVNKYGGKMGAAKGEIHPHIKMTHKKMIQSGKKIEL